MKATILDTETVSYTLIILLPTIHQRKQHCAPRARDGISMGMASEMLFGKMVEENHELYYE